MCRSARCTPRTAAGSSSAGSAPIDGEEVPFADVAKGYELPDGEMVVLTDEDLAHLPLPTARSIEVLNFSPADQVDPILWNRSYYVEPETAGARAYVLLRDALERSGKVAVTKVALRQRESLATLRTRDGLLVLETHAVARRGPRRGLRVPGPGHRRPRPGTADGDLADRLDDRGLRAGRVPRRVPGGAAGAGRGQGRGPRRDPAPPRPPPAEPASLRTRCRPAWTRPPRSAPAAGQAPAGQGGRKASA